MALSFFWQVISHTARSSCTLLATELKEYLVTTFPVSSNYDCSCREINLPQASPSLSQLQTEVFFRLQSADQDTTPAGVIFVSFTFFSYQQWNKQQGSLMQEPSPGRMALSSCLPALNSSSKTLSSLREHPPSHSPVWAHTLLSHCWYATSFSSPRLSAFGALWTRRKEHDVPWRQQPDAKAEHSISEKRVHSPRSQPASSTSPALLLPHPCLRSGWFYPFVSPITPGSVAFSWGTWLSQWALALL